MITDTINKLSNNNLKSKHPYYKAYWGKYKLWNFRKRLIKKILG